MIEKKKKKKKMRRRRRNKDKDERDRESYLSFSTHASVPFVAQIRSIYK